MTIRIAIIDDEPKMGQVLKRSLSREGWETENYDDPVAAIERLERDPVDIVLTDLKMPEMDGLEVLDRIKKFAPGCEVVMMTAYASAPTAVEAMKKGAFDYLIKPFAVDELKILIRRILESRDLREDNSRLEEENSQLRDMVGDSFRVDNLIAVSEPMRRVIEQLRKVARKHATVLLRGDSGTGKEVLATAIHVNSPRAKGAFLKINCGALPENLLESELFGHVKGAFTGADANRVGLFEAADGGTLFLDEIGEVSPALQVKLLRVLQTGEFQRVGESTSRHANVRVIAATHRPLEEMIESGEFRQDLYYRLNVVPIRIPPLRERREDISALIDHFITLARKKNGGGPKTIEADARGMLEAHDWPGNIRELENAIEHAIVMCEGDRLCLEDLPFSIQGAGTGGGGGGAPGDGDSGALERRMQNMTLAEIERLAIEGALDRAKYNYTRAAKLLGITRRTLGYRMKKYKIPGKNGEPFDGEGEA